MIPRYTSKPFADLWSDRTRYAVWLEVELCACEALESAGYVPRGTAAAIRAKNITPDVAEIESIEQKTRHDVIAFLTHVEQRAGDPARWLHRGMTSSDVLDTSFALLWNGRAARPWERTSALLRPLWGGAGGQPRSRRMGRSHAIPPDPWTFGGVLPGHLAGTKR